MKAEYNIGFPGYKSYKVSKEKTRELTHILVDYADCNSPCIKISFKEREEFDHAVSITFTFIGMFGDISLNIDSAELSIYLSRIKPFEDYTVAEVTEELLLR